MRPRGNSPFAISKFTTQKTSKNLKAQGCFAFLVTIAGMLTLMVGFSEHSDATKGGGALLLVVGFSWAFVVRLRRWWHHE